ncbi:MAG TPA: hypothetical protein VNJ46_06020, partial [Gaiellaceae bacterium]|nr:hypothetical protein [Gaiellaceae bacterium]
AAAAALACAASAPRAQPAPAGETAIFYYPWYSTPARDGRWAHWYVERSGTPVLAIAFYPLRGLYSSSDPRIVAAHMREIAAAGIDTVVVSWWGPGSVEDERLPLVQAAARREGLRVALHLEPYAGRTPERAVADVERLRAFGIRDVYVYDADRDAPAAWAAALSRLQGVRVFAHTTLVGRARAAGFDGVYTYDVAIWTGRTFRRLCAQARAAGLLCAPSVGPGYDARLATGHALVRPRQNGRVYDGMWRAALRAGADVVTITSYNEWQEGTQLEPARPQVGRPGYEGAWGRTGVAAARAYLEATARWTTRLRQGR